MLCELLFENCTSDAISKQLWPLLNLPKQQPKQPKRTTAAPEKEEELTTGNHNSTAENQNQPIEVNMLLARLVKWEAELEKGNGDRVDCPVYASQVAADTILSRVSQNTNGKSNRADDTRADGPGLS